MKHVLPETPKPTVQKFETRDRMTTPPSVTVKRRVLDSLPSTSAAVETTWEYPEKIEIEIDDEGETF